MPVSTSDTAGKLDFVCRRGDTFFRNMAFKVNDVDEDFTGTTLKMQVRDNGAVLAEASIVVDASNVQVTITADVTATFPEGKFFYDLQQTLANGNIKTRIAGAFIVMPDYTT